jgi:hypothetical protein
MVNRHPLPATGAEVAPRAPSMPTLTPSRNVGTPGRVGESTGWLT